MFHFKHITLWYFLVIFAFTKGEISTTHVEKLTSLEALKEIFTKAIMDTILKFSPVINKFEVRYLGSANSMYYAKEIAKAIAYAPLFNGKEGVEYYITEHLSKITLPCSTMYCEDPWCIVSSIADITADVSIQGQFITPDLTEQVVIKKANNLAGNVLWRLSRIPDPDPDVLLAQANLSPKIANRVFQFIKMLSTEIYNSQYVSDFFKETGLNSSITSVISSPVCGSSYLGFNIGLIPELSTRMSDIYRKTKPTYTANVNSTLDSMVMSSIVSEAIALKLLKQGFFENNDSLEEASHDIVKLIMVGITSSRMKIHGYNYARNAIKTSIF